MKQPKFKTLSDFQNFIRQNNAPDVAEVEGMIFTMDEYDMDGKELTYGNVKHQKSIIVVTSDRYNKEIKFSDAVCTMEDECFFRNDISYEE